MCILICLTFTSMGLMGLNVHAPSYIILFNPVSVPALDGRTTLG